MSTRKKAETTSSPAQRHAHKNRVTGVRFAPDGGSVVGFGYDAVVRWQLAGGEAFRIDQAGDDTPSLWHGVFAPDASILVAGGHPKNLVVLDARTGRARTSLPAPSNIFAVASSTDGALFAVGARPQVQLWERGKLDARTPRPRWTTDVGKIAKVHTPHVSSLAFSPDGTKLVATCGNAVTVLQVADGAVVYAAKVDRFGATAALFLDDDHVLSIGLAGVLEVRDITKKAKKATRSATAGKFNALALRAGVLVGGGDDVQVWDAATLTRRAVLSGVKKSVDDVDIAPDGKRVAAGGLDCAVLLWDL